MRVFSYAPKNISLNRLCSSLFLLLFGAISLVFTQTTWEECTVPTKADLMGVEFGNNLFITVGDSGIVLTSSDGTAWTKQTSGASQLLRGVTWGNNQFIAVGDEGTILTSPDGTTWTSQTSGTTKGLAEVKWGNNEYIVVGDTGTVLTSTDGSAWTVRTSGVTEQLDDVVWANSMYVAVGNNGTIITSPDGAAWTAQTANSDFYFRGVAWDGAKFLAIGQEEEGSGDPLIVDTSANGTEWTPIQINNGEWAEWIFSLMWDGSQFIAVGFFGSIITSIQGVTWEDKTHFLLKDLQDITKSNDLYVTVGEGGKVLKASASVGIQSQYKYNAAKQVLIEIAYNHLRYQLTSVATVTIKLYDLKGQLVHKVIHYDQEPGLYTTVIPANCARGRYLVSFQAGEKKIRTSVFLTK